jgi:hypothetical protein
MQQNFCFLCHHHFRQSKLDHLSPTNLRGYSKNSGNVAAYPYKEGCGFPFNELTLSITIKYQTRLKRLLWTNGQAYFSGVSVTEKKVLKRLPSAF